MAHPIPQTKPQSRGQPHLVADDAGNTGCLLDHFAHVVEGFHVEGNQDSMARPEPHIVPLGNCRSCEPAVSEPAALVEFGKVSACGHYAFRRSVGSAHQGFHWSGTPPLFCTLRCELRLNCASPDDME